MPARVPARRARLGATRSQRQRVEQPAEQVRRADEGAEEPRAEPDLVADLRRGTAPRRPRRRTRRTGSSGRDDWSLAPLGDVVGVEHREHVQQARDDGERVAVLERRRHRAAQAGAEALRHEIREADAEVGARRETDERIAEVEREDAALDPEPDGEHHRQQHEERQALLRAALPQMAGTGHGPRGRANHECGCGGGRPRRGGHPL